MSNFFESLKHYFEVTPRDQVLADWEESAEFDKIGPTVEEFLHNTTKYYQINSDEPHFVSLITLQNLDPKFTSGFLMYIS
jgi:hypothetical protein